MICIEFAGAQWDIVHICKVLPGFEPGLLDSKSRVITDYTIGP